VRLLCDEMLRGLGRWLRAAGHDTLIARAGTADRDLIGFARAERRILLTCDRELARLAGDAAKVLSLASQAPDQAACELRARLGLNWLAAPFSRCLLDNAELRPASAVQAAALPEASRAGAGPILACPECGRVYWPGSHVRRMRARLERWQRL
jgi:uncharacterized protein with PIN domain